MSKPEQNLESRTIAKIKEAVIDSKGDLTGANSQLTPKELEEAKRIKEQKFPTKKE